MSETIETNNRNATPENPRLYGASPMAGNFTGDTEEHLWCANALGVALSDPDRSIGELNDDIQAALRYLLSREIARAMKACEASTAARKGHAHTKV